MVIVDALGPPSGLDGVVGGIRNQAFRRPKRVIILVSQACFEGLSHETPKVPKFVFISQNPSFDQHPSSPAEQPNKPCGSKR
jgi:hypothetical protein